jgi:sigma-B regulation protein RsbU (phosphoserine phosphatase)
MLAGDYYDLFEVSPGQVAMALGDVMGKGLGAALVMAELHALVRSRFRHGPVDLAGLMEELNDELLHSTPPDLFVTLFLGVLDLGTAEFRFVNAGHPCPIILSGTENPVRLSQGGTVVGVFPGERYLEAEVSLPPASVLALFSDGLTEARNAVRGLFGEQGVVKVLRACWGSPGAAVLRALLKAVERHAEEAVEADDISVILIRRLL